MEEEKRSGAGRPSKYKEEYCEQMIEYFNVEITEEKIKQTVSAGQVVEVKEEEASELPTFIGFAMKIGVCDDTLSEWKVRHVKFSAAYKKCRKLQEQLIAKNGIKGRYNTTFSLFMLKCNHGWNDKAAETEANRTFTLNYNLDDKEESE